MGDIFFTILFQPLYNALVGLYVLVPWGGVGVSIIILTAIVKFAVFPLTYKSLKSQKEMQEIQPKIEEIKVKYKDNQEQLAKELMGVYKAHNVNPFAACLPTILQLFVFIALFQVLSAGLGTIDPAKLYSFIPNPESMNHVFLGMDLTKVAIPFAILSAAAQYLQARQMINSRPPKAARATAGSLDEDMTATMNRMTLTVLPLMMLVMGVTTLPGGVTLYIFVSTVLTYLLYAYFIGGSLLPWKGKVEIVDKTSPVEIVQK